MDFVKLLVLMRYEGPPSDSVRSTYRESIPAEEDLKKPGLPKSLRILFAISLGLFGVLSLLIMVDCIRAGDSLPLIAVFALIALAAFWSGAAFVFGFRSIGRKALARGGGMKEPRMRRSHGLGDLNKELVEEFEPLKPVPQTFLKISAVQTRASDNQGTEFSDLKHDSGFPKRVRESLVREMRYVHQ